MRNFKHARNKKIASFQTTKTEMSTYAKNNGLEFDVNAHCIKKAENRERTLKNSNYKNQNQNLDLTACDCSASESI